MIRLTSPCIPRAAARRDLRREHPRPRPAAEGQLVRPLGRRLVFGGLGLLVSCATPSDSPPTDLAPSHLPALAHEAQSDAPSDSPLTDLTPSQVAALAHEAQSAAGLLAVSREALSKTVVLDGQGALHTSQVSGHVRGNGAFVTVSYPAASAPWPSRATCEREDARVWCLLFDPSSGSLVGATLAPACAGYASHPPLGVVADYAVFGFEADRLVSYYCERWHEGNNPPRKRGVELHFDQAGQVLSRVYHGMFATQ